VRVECVLDSSAVLALVFAEEGHAVVEPLLPVAALSAVNAAEVLAKLQRLGASPADAAKAVDDLQLAVLPFTLDDARLAARLEPLTRTRGLSLGDRACLALAQRCGVPAVTADRHWRIPRLPVKVRCIR
jgi:PIN domain nuclease of toxin-antitoxin system